MADRLTEQGLYTELISMIDRLKGLSAIDSRIRDELQGEIRSGLNQALADERAVKDTVRHTRSQLNTLAGQVGRLAARAGVESQAPGSSDAFALPSNVRGFPRAIESVQHDVISAESSWEWVERARAASAREASAASPPPPPPAGTAQSPAATQDRQRRGCLGKVVGVFGKAALLTVVMTLSRHQMREG